MVHFVNSGLKISAYAEVYEGEFSSRGSAVHTSEETTRIFCLLISVGIALVRFGVFLLIISWYPANNCGKKWKREEGRKRFATHQTFQ